jgi:hypothetical protein
VVKKKPTRRPTPAEIQSAYDQVDSFHLFKTGRNIVQDPMDKESIIAFIEFIKYEDLTEKNLADLNFLARFLKKSKKFISPVATATRTWRGLMWVIGWRKSSNEDQIIGKYIKQLEEEDKAEFHDHYCESDRVGDIIGHHFKTMANTPFQANQDLMKKHNIPSFASLQFHDEKTDSDCSPHLVFTNKDFFNAPHIDEGDVSQFAFVMFLPTFTSDGTIASPSSGYDISSGPFVFPDHKFGINFDHQHGIVKMIWQANRYKHGTMPSTQSPLFTCLGMSVQINLRIANACERYQKGLYDYPKAYFGDHFFYFYRTVAAVLILLVNFIFI